MNWKLKKPNGRTGLGRLGRIGSLAVAGLIAALAGLVVPLAVASPAQAGPPNYCSGGELGPYWFGAVGATNAAGHRKVVAISEPWGNGSFAYLWDDNNDARQQFCLEYLFNDMQNANEKYYLLRYNAVESLCLTWDGEYRGAFLRLKPCDDMNLNQYFGWENLPGQSVKPKGEPAYSRPYRLHSPTDRGCLDVYNAGSTNYTVMQFWDCNGQDNQLFF